jgi:hypothetical protein
VRCRQGVAMLKKTVIITLTLLLVVLSSGCFGGSSRTLREDVARLDAAVVKYDTIRGMYNSGNYTEARQEYIAMAATFTDCQSALTKQQNGNVTALEKKILVSLAGCSGQFAYASRYMRDACTEALKKGENNEYLMKISADELELTARTIYQTNRKDLDQLWASQR